MLRCILFYDDRGRWWQPGNYLTKVIDSTSDIEVYNHGVIPEDIYVLDTIDQLNKPIDFILVVDSGSTHHKLHHFTDKIKATNTKTAIWLSDTHVGWNDRKNWVKQFRYDYVFVAQKDAIAKVIHECQYNPNQVVWLPHAADSDILQPSGTYVKKHDAVSVGFMNENRSKIFPIIKSLVNFEHKTTIWAWSVAKAYQESKMGINIPVANDPLNMRLFEIGACKIPQVVSYPDNDPNGLFDHFVDGQDILTFENSNIEKMKELIVRLLTNRDIRDHLANNMYQKVVNHHTYKHRLNTILETMGYEVSY